MKEEKNTPKNNQENPLNRKEALKKVGKYAAFTAATMMVLMSPVNSSAAQNSPRKPKHH